MNLSSKGSYAPLTPQFTTFVKLQALRTELTASLCRLMMISLRGLVETKAPTAEEGFVHLHLAGHGLPAIVARR